MRVPQLLLVAMLLSACASGPTFDTSGVATGLTPREAAGGPQVAVGQQVLWGGVIVAGSNRETGTRLEVLAYPLASNQRPDLDARPTGRFLIVQDDYLELADYRAGRQITVVGPVVRIDQGQVGEAPYQYPVVDAERLHLWSVERGGGRPNFHIGVGVIFSN